MGYQPNYAGQLNLQMVRWTEPKFGVIKAGDPVTTWPRVWRRLSNGIYRMKTGVWPLAENGFSEVVGKEFRKEGETVG